MVANGDIIYLGTRAFVNVKTDNRLMSKMITNNAEEAYSFNFYFGRHASESVKKQYSGTFWMRAPELDVDAKHCGQTQELAIAR